MLAFPLSLMDKIDPHRSKKLTHIEKQTQIIEAENIFGSKSNFV